MARTHSFPADAVHHRWDAHIEPVIVVDSGDTVVLTTREVSDGQVTPASEASAVSSLDFARFYPLAGPIGVNDAAPGDTLAIEVVELRARGWGWTAIIPGEGLLPADFPDPYLRVFDLDEGDTTRFRDDIAIPVEPFLGTMGVCPAGARDQRVTPPGAFGGNIDTRQLTRGSTLYLPVEEAGALFSCGDGHAAQGDGEVCGTGLESPLEAELRLTLERGRHSPAPQFLTAGPLTPRVDGGGSFGTTGVGPDLYRAAQDAARAMIEHLTRSYDLSPEDAYVLASLCVDLKVAEIVNAGEYVVSAVLPLSVFRSSS